MAGPTLRIEAPARAARKGGITKVAEVRENGAIGNAEAVVYQSDGCTFPYTEEVRCYAASTPPDKTYAGIEVEDAIGAPFTIVAGVACFINPDPDEKERARRLHDEGRDRVLEEVAEAWASAGTALAAGGSVDGAIAIIDQELDDKYVGQGVILMSRGDAVRAEFALTLGADSIPYTINGTPVIASGRVAPGTVYGLGAIVIEHTPILEVDGYDFEKNKHHALAEAIYVLAVDCEFRVKSSTGA